MAEIIQKDGTWAFDGDALRLTPGRDKGVGLLRRALGELTVPLGALAGVSFEQGRKTGRLRLRLRDGADPLLQATGGKLGEGDDPYQLTVAADRYGVAEYFVEAVRGALLLDGVPTDAVDRYLLPGPAVPLSCSAGDGTASFDGEHVRLEWNWKTEETKTAGGPRTLAVAEITAVEWRPSAGLEHGCLRFTVPGADTGRERPRPKHDPHCVELWGFRKDPLMALVAAAVQARLPHPAAAPAADAVTRRPELPKQSGPPVEDEHDALLRRLRELGELHRSRVLTDEEFAMAKRAVLKGMWESAD